MAELIPTKDEAAWLDARRKGITASEIAVIMGIAPDSYGSAYRLYHEKLGILPGDEVPDMERGRVLEPYVAGKFAEAHPEFAVLGDGRRLYAHSGRPWQMATPDGVVHALADVDHCTCYGGDSPYGHEPRCGWELDGPVAVAEFKTALSMDEWGEPGTDEIPVHYRAQALQQMDVMEVPTAYVTVLDVQRWKVSEYVIEHGPRCTVTRDAPFGPDCRACGDLVLMREAGLEFLGRIERQDPPDVDWRPATLGALKQLHPSLTDETAEIGPQLADRYEAAVKNAKHWERRKKLYEAQIREKAGSAHRVVRTGPGQVPVARRDVYPVGESVRKGYTVDKLVPTPPRPKKEKKSASSDSE